MVLNLIDSSFRYVSIPRQESVSIFLVFAHLSFVKHFIYSLTLSISDAKKVAYSIKGKKSRERAINTKQELQDKIFYYGQQYFVEVAKFIY